MFGDQVVDGLFIEQREDLDVALGVLVAGVEPELVELVRRRITRVEPYVAALGLAELGAVGFGNQRAGEGESLAAGLAADQLRAGGDVAPLVGAAELQFTTYGFVQVQEVVGLHELVGEFGERHPFAFAVEAFLYRIFGHHVVHGNQLADVADEIQEGDSLHPVVVVHQHRRVGSVRFEIEQLGELFLDRLLVVAEGLFIEQVALLRFAAGVADHARRAAHQSDRTVSAHLEVLEDHYTHQVSDVQRIRRRVDAHVSCRHLFLKLFLCARHDRVNHTAPFQFFDKVLNCHLCIWFYFMLYSTSRSSARRNSASRGFFSVIYLTRSSSLIGRAARISSLIVTSSSSIPCTPDVSAMRSSSSVLLRRISSRRASDGTAIRITCP